jgi:hypothetical protein
MMITINIPNITDTVNTPKYLKINGHSIVAIKSIYGENISNEIMKKDVFLMLLFRWKQFYCH